MNKKTFEDTCKAMQQSKAWIDPERWLTMQFELGYSTLNVGAVNVSKFWFEKLLRGLAELRKRKGGQLSRHWKATKRIADNNASKSPMLERGLKSGLVA
jgi:hypothetical protein